MIFTIFAISALIAAVSISIYLIVMMYEFATRNNSKFVGLLMAITMVLYILSFSTAVGTGIYLLVKK